MADVTEKLERLASLLEKGLITRAQFDQQRDSLLSTGTAPPTTRPSTVGSYKITGEIGVGGMGRVYRGRHRTTAFADRQGGDVAIKVLHAQYAERPDIVERFEREAALGIKLDHPGIVRVHELAVDAGQVALVMEVVEGRCNGCIELRPERAWSMGRCAWQAAKAGFEGVWSSNSVG